MDDTATTKAEKPAREWNRRRIARIKDNGIRAIAYFVYEMRDADGTQLIAALRYLQSRYSR